MCFTAPSAAAFSEIIGGSAGDLRGELMALFGRLPNLGGRLLSESFRANGGGKMKTAQSAPELKWLLDGGSGPGNIGGGEGGGGGGRGVRGGGAAGVNGRDGDGADGVGGRREGDGGGVKGKTKPGPGPGPLVGTGNNDKNDEQVI